VQLALLTATVKLFIQRPTKGQELVPKVLKWATEETDNPDLRDRGYMYWRLLSSDMDAAKKIVMGEKPPITAESETLDRQTLEEMCLVVGTLATVYLKPVQQVFRNARPRRLPDSPALVRQVVEDVANGYNGLAAANPAAGNMNAAVSAADDFFAGVGSRGMANMNINDGFGEDSYGGGVQGRQDMGYVVNQNAPNQMYAPVQGHGANGDLLS
jgi:hypothetical protein